MTVLFGRTILTREVVAFSRELTADISLSYRMINIPLIVSQPSAQRHNKPKREPHITA